MKKNMLLIAALLAVCIAGQVFLKPHTGAGNCYAQSLEQEKTSDLLTTQDLLTQDAAKPKADTLQGNLFRQFMVMLLFVAAIGAGAWFLNKKMSGRWGVSRSRHIHVAETVNLGPRKHLHIVQVGRKQFLISNSADGIRLLSEVTDCIPGDDAQ